jgi:redox-sensitive bicupin YhaK (pirin superfamily)
VAAQDLVRVRRSAERFTTVGDGVRTRHLLSFGGHYDPTQTTLGPLIAHNDEVVEPGSRYAPHRHRGVEIVTWVVSGRLLHRDPNGEALLEPGSAQLLRAGSGVVHEEIATAVDASDPDAVDGDPLTAPRPLGATRFVQMWLSAEDASAPQHTFARFDDAELRSRLVPIAAGSAASVARAAGTLELADHDDACCLVGRLPIAVARPLPSAPAVHLFVVYGSLTVRGFGDEVRLDSGDSALLTKPSEAECLGVADAEIVVWAWGG